VASFIGKHDLDKKGSSLAFIRRVGLDILGINCLLLALK
jgi:hypothetical protein